MKNKERRFWEHPWGYKESFLIAFTILIVGMLVEALTYGYAPTTPVWPYNLIILIGFVLWLIIANRFLKTGFIKWLSGVPAAIASICVFTVLVLFMGAIQQVRRPGFIDLIGLTDVVSSWQYLFCSFFLLLTLGMTTVNKFRSFSFRNIAFFLNHAGLWIIIAGASLGSGDLQRYRMHLVKDRALFYATDEYNQQIRMPFTLKLINFNIDEYPPKIGLMNPSNGKIYLEKGDKLPEVTPNGKYIFGDWKVSVSQYLETAKLKDSIYQNNKDIGAVPVVYVHAKNTQSGIKKEGWVTSGSFLVQPDILLLDELHAVAMTVPSSKKFSSKIRVFKKVKEYYDIELEVNKPKTVQGWKIYQTGYDEKMGKWSRLSIVELVKDPWLPVVYVGIFMVLLGSLYLVWMGKSKQEKK